MARTPTSPTGDAPRGARGITLIELVVAMGIVAMIAVLALPRLQSAAPRLELRTAAEALRADLRAARNASLGLNRETTVTFDVDAGEWRDDEGRVGRPPEGVAMTLEAARREQESDSVARIRFFPDGGATGGVIELRNGSDAVEVRVDWLDGRVTVAEIEPE